MASRKTLSELVQEGGTPDEIIATFAYYVDRGTAISGRSVSAIVAQVQWQPQQLDAAYASLERGLRNAVLDGKSRDTGEYLYAIEGDGREDFRDGRGRTREVLVERDHPVAVDLPRVDASTIRLESPRYLSLCSCGYWRDAHSACSASGLLKTCCRGEDRLRILTMR